MLMYNCFIIELGGGDNLAIVKSQNLRNSLGHNLLIRTPAHNQSKPPYDNADLQEGLADT